MKTLRINKPTWLLLLAVGAWLNLNLSAHAQTTWNGGSGFTNVWSEPLNWNTTAVPTSTDAVLFDNVSGVTNVQGAVNNVMDVTNSVNTISYTARADLGNYHTTQIPTGQTLSVLGTSGTLFNIGTGADDGGAAQVNIVMSGGGNLVVGSLASPAGTFQVVQASATSGSHTANLDLSGLNSFSAGVSLLLVGDGVTTARRAGILTLAKTNVIRATSSATTGAIRVGNISTGNGGGISEIILGQENTISADFLRIAGRRASVGNVRFQPGLINPTLKLRGADTIGRMGTLSLGDNRENSTSTSVTGTLDATGATVDILVATMIFGFEAPANPPGGTGIVNLDAGTLDVITLNLGSQQADSSGSASGTLNLNGTTSAIIGTLNIGGDRGANTGTGTGVLNIGGGTVTVTGNIVENNATGGNGSSTINMTNGTLKVGGTVRVDNLNLTSASVTLAIGPAINDTNPVCSVTSLNLATNGGAPVVTLNVSGFGFAPGQYPLIKYTGTIGGGGYDIVSLGSLPPRALGYLSNNTANSSIDVVITGVSAAKWDGTVNGDWDINGTTNWIDLSSSIKTIYLENVIPGDPVIFDDTAGGTKTVNLTTNLSPVAVAVTNSSAPYIFHGPGGLTGPGGLSKNGSGTWVLTNSGVNSFSGTVAVNEGVLKLGLAANRLPAGANVTLADVSGALLDLGNQDQTLNTLSGGGPSGGSVNLGTGTLTVAGSSTYLGNITGAGVLRKASGTLTLGGNSTYSGGTVLVSGTTTLINTSGSALGTGPVDMTSGTLNVGTGGSAGLAPGLIITNNGAIVFDATNDTTLNSIHGTGTVTKNNTNTVILNGASSYTGATTISGGALRINDANGLGDTTGGTAIGSGATAHLELLGDITVFENFSLSQKGGASGQVPHIANVSGTNTLSGSIVGGAGGSYWSFRSDAGKLIVNGTFTHTPTSNRRLRLFGAGDGDWATDYPAGNATARVTMEGPGTWTLSAVNTYNSDTELYGGTLIVNGQIQSGGTVIVGDPSTSTPAKLAGTGIIAGPVMVNTNGTIAPGSSIGTLTINNVLTLTGIAEMEVSPSSADQIAGLTGVALGGTLKVTVSGSMTNGAAFKLFDAPAGTYSGDFAVYDLPTLPAPLVWDHSTMPTDGTLRVTTGVQPPQIATFGRSGDGNFQLAGTGPNNSAYRILATTNIALPLTNWVQIGSGAFTGGAFSFTDLNATNHALRFYSVVTP